MIGEALKCNSTLTELDLESDKTMVKKKRKKKKIEQLMIKCNMNSEQYWR